LSINANSLDDVDREVCDHTRPQGREPPTVVETISCFVQPPVQAQLSFFVTFAAFCSNLLFRPG
jgi:hypothetical protein